MTPAKRTFTGGWVCRPFLMLPGGTNRIIELLCYSKLETIKSLGSGEVDIVEAEVPHLLVGRTVNDLTEPEKSR